MNKKDNPFSIEDVRLLNIAKDTLTTGLEQIFLLCLEKDKKLYRESFKAICEMLFLDSLQAFEQIYYFDDDGKIQPKDMVEQVKDDINLIDGAFYKTEKQREDDD